MQARWLTERIQGKMTKTDNEIENDMRTELELRLRDWKQG